MKELACILTAFQTLFLLIHASILVVTTNGARSRLASFNRSSAIGSLSFLIFGHTPGLPFLERLIKISFNGFSLFLFLQRPLQESQ